MKKLIIEIDEQCYEDVINDPEWDALSDVLSFAIYFKEILKEGKPLKEELVEMQNDMHLSTVTGITGKTLIDIRNIDEIIDKHIGE